MTASWGLRIVGSGTLWTSTLLVPIQHSAFIVSSPGFALRVNLCRTGFAIQSRRRGNFFAVHRFLHSRNNAARAVWLALNPRDFAGFRQSFEMPQILNDRLFGIAADNRFPSAGQFAEAKFLKNGDHAPSAAGCRLENNFTGIVRFAADGAPGNASPGLIGQD